MTSGLAVAIVGGPLLSVVKGDKVRALVVGGALANKRGCRLCEERSSRGELKLKKIQVM